MKNQVPEDYKGFKRVVVELTIIALAILYAYIIFSM